MMFTLPACVLLLLTCFIVTVLLTAAIRFYALRRGLLDTPGERSSHTLPTPRGGGLAIVIVVFAAILLVLKLTNSSSVGALTVVCCGALLVAAVGFWDDHGHVRSDVRLSLHLLVGVAFVLLLPRFSITLFSVDIASGIVGVCILALTVAWYINLFNFMDGINGIAALEAVFIFSSYALLANRFAAPELTVPMLCVAASVAGFALWNFPRANIFMGDVGSGFLGALIIGFLFLLSAAGEGLFYAGLLLSGVFVVDASLTLLCRLCRAEPVHQAHRTHAYQHAARQYHSHVVVTLAVQAINIVWLLPMAWLAAAELLPGWVALLLGYLPLLLLALHFNAGQPE